MPQCQFPGFCYSCVSEKLYRKYSRNWTKQKPKFLFSRHGTESKAETEGEQRAATPCHGMGHPMPWHEPPLGRARLWGGPLVHPLTLSFRLYILLDEKTLKARTLFEKTYCKPPPSSTKDREGPEALPGTLPEREITTGGLLHLHACLQSDVWVVYLGLRVHSSS
jgi:hypothetical protein